MVYDVRIGSGEEPVGIRPTANRRLRQSATRIPISSWLQRLLRHRGARLSAARQDHLGRNHPSKWLLGFVCLGKVRERRSKAPCAAGTDDVKTGEPVYRGWPRCLLLSMMVALLAGPASSEDETLAPPNAHQAAELVDAADKSVVKTWNAAHAAEVSGRCIGSKTAVDRAGSGVARKMEGRDMPPRVAPARDGNVAIEQEFDTLVCHGTIESMKLFVKRHPQHPLADAARRRIRNLKRTESGK